MSVLWDRWVTVGLRSTRKFWVFFAKYAARIGCGCSKKYMVGYFDFLFKICQHLFCGRFKFVKSNGPNVCTC